MELNLEKITKVGKDTNGSVTEARQNAFTGRKTLSAALLTGALFGAVACAGSPTSTIQVPSKDGGSEAREESDAEKGEVSEFEGDGGALDSSTVKPSVDGSVTTDAAECTTLAGKTVCMTATGPVIVVDAATVSTTDGPVAADGSVTGPVDGSVVGDTSPASTGPITDGAVPISQDGPTTVDGTVVGDAASEGPACQGASTTFKDYMNLDQPLQYGSWTITYKGIVATDGGASMYDLSFACGNGPATDQLLPGGVSKIDGLTVILSSGGRSAVFATISSN